MKMHPRVKTVASAECDFVDAWIAIVEKHGLTTGEQMGLLAHRLSLMSKYTIRGERHPNDPDKGGDEE